ncbi:hypothetical protein ACQPU1_06000 [Clostridium paraputrificum]|uniref:hypothetical protein n=1 Tax=Clostridium paraputrificum TaxID=29363 RepID=UPI003D34D404
MSELIEKKLSYRININKYTLECVHGYFDQDVSDFIAERYYNSDGYEFNTSLDELKEKIKEEDKMYIYESYIYTVYDENKNIMGSIRKILKLNHKDLPIEREFNLSLNKYLRKHPRIYEIARFTIKDCNPRVLKILFKEGLKDYDYKALMVASLDSNVLEGLRKLGFNWIDIGESKSYLGSVTVPVILERNKINNIFNRTINRI